MLNNHNLKCVNTGFSSSALHEHKRECESFCSKAQGFGPGPFNARTSRDNNLLLYMSMQEAPYVMTTDDSQGDSDTSLPRYHGYVVDLLDALSKRAHFTYSLYAISDGQPGYKRPNGTWTGLVGQLTNGVRYCSFCCIDESLLIRHD